MKLLISVFLLAIIVGAGYFAYKQIDYTNQTATPQIFKDAAFPNTFDPTAEWVLYTDDTQTFQFRYPKAWRITTIDRDSNKKDIHIIPPIKRSDLGDSISIVIHENPNNLTVEQLANTFLAGGPYQFESVTVYGLSAKKPIDLPEAAHTERIYIPKNEKIYEVFIQSDDGEYLEIFNRMLASFIFIDLPLTEKIVDTSNWQTYLSRNYGYSIKFPTEWETYGYGATPNIDYDASERFFRPKGQDSPPIMLDVFQYESEDDAKKISNRELETAIQSFKISTSNMVRFRHRQSVFTLYAEPGSFDILLGMLSTITFTD